VLQLPVVLKKWTKLVTHFFTPNVILKKVFVITFY